MNEIKEKWLIKNLVHKARFNSRRARDVSNTATINFCQGKRAAYMIAARLIKGGF